MKSSADSSRPARRTNSSDRANPANPANRANRANSGDRADPVEAAREAALRFLDHRRLTRSELERKLRDRGHELAAIAAALDRLERVDLVNDYEYARVYVSARLARRPVGLRVLRQQLRARGIDEDTMARAFASLQAESEARPEDEGLAARRADGAGERARAARALAPLMRRYRNLDPREARARCATALARRGFDYETIADVLAAVRE